MLLPFVMMMVVPVTWSGTLNVSADVSSSMRTTIDTAFNFDPGAALGGFDLMIQDEAEPQPIDGPGEQFRTVERFGRDGSWRWNVYGGWAAEFGDSNNWLGLGGLGLSHFIADGLSLDLEFNGLTIQQRETDAGAFNINLLFRWHFVMERTWSIYADGGAGVLLATEEVPAGGSNFNFTPQAGVGFTLEVAEDVRLLGGVRWHHISNARTHNENPARDSLLLYAGLTFPF